MLHMYIRMHICKNFLLMLLMTNSPQALDSTRNPRENELRRMSLISVKKVSEMNKMAFLSLRHSFPFSQQSIRKSSTENPK